MAREMNVEKRSEALRTIVEKTAASAAKAQKIAEDLSARFQGDKSAAGKRAREIAANAKKLGSALNKVSQAAAG